MKMAAILLSFFLLSVATTCEVKALDAPESKLIGGWRCVGECPMEQFELTRDGSKQVYRSWIHDAPEILDGRWKIVGGDIELTFPDDEPPQRWKVRVIDNEALEIEDQGEVSRFQRIHEVSPKPKD